MRKLRVRATQPPLRFGIRTVRDSLISFVSFGKALISLHDASPRGEKVISLGLFLRAHELFPERTFAEGCANMYERAALPSQAPRRIGVQGGEERASEYACSHPEALVREGNGSYTCR